MAERTEINASAALVDAELPEVRSIVAEAQAILRSRVYESGAPALFGALDLVDLAADVIASVDRGQCDAEVGCLLEEARNKVYFAHGVLELVMSQQDDRALFGALRLLKEAEQRADKLFERHADLCSEACHG